MKSLEGSHRIEDRRIFLKTSVALSFINTYVMSLISAGSISLDSTFKLRFVFRRGVQKRSFLCVSCLDFFIYHIAVGERE